MKTFLLIFLCFFFRSAYAEVVLSPNMSLPVPVVGTTPGPAWANDINSCMSAIDGHDHTPGYGVQIPPNGLNINSNLTMNGNSLTSTKSIAFQSQTSLSSTQNIYSEGGDLWYNDASGNIIRITQNGSVTGATGTITGLPSGTASASYQSASGTFQFQSATNTPANISGASYLIQQQTASPNGITVSSPNSLAASYTLTLPTALPSVTSFLMESSAGVFSNRAITVPTVQKFTTGSGTYNTPAGVLYIKVTMVGGGGGGAAADTNTGSDGGNSTFGTSLFTANGGSGGQPNNGLSGVGGSATITGLTGLTLKGNGGSGGSTSNTTSCGAGGGSFLGGGASALAASSGATGNAGATNTGGGGGGGAAGSGHTGTGGGGGGGIICTIASPSSSYGYAVGAGGAGGTAGGNAGGAGGSGVIEVEEFYQ